jgi:hypothetical protein
MSQQVPPTQNSTTDIPQYILALRPVVEVDLPEDGYDIANNLKAVLVAHGIVVTDNMLKLFYVLGVQSIRDKHMLYRLNRGILSENLATYFDGRVGLITTLCLIGYFLEDKSDNYTLPGDFVPDLSAFVRHPNLTLADSVAPKGVYTTQWKSSKLDEFNGDPTKWCEWKKSTSFTFSLCGLHEVITSRTFAKSNIAMNAAVHAMLALSLASASLVPVTLDKLEGDGNRVWANLCTFYESEKMITIYLTKLNKEFESLKVTKMADFMKYVSRFNYITNEMKALYKKCKDNDYSTHVRPISNLHAQFFEKLQIEELKPRKEILRRQGKDLDLPSYFTELFEDIIENGYHYNGDTNSKGTKTHVYEGTKQPGHPSPKVKFQEPATPKGGEGHSKKDRLSYLYSLIKTADPEDKKVFQSQIDKLKSPTDGGQAKRSRREAKKEAKRQRRNQVAGGGSIPDIDLDTV